VETAFHAATEGDVQRIEIEVPKAAAATRRFVLTYEEGTDAFTRVELPEAGRRSEGLRVLRARVEDGALRLLVEGRGGRSYPLGVRSPRTVSGAPGVTVAPSSRGAALTLSFEGPSDVYVRRSIVLPLR